MTDIPIALPEPSRRYAQDEEWCLARLNGEWRELRFHDYSRIFEVPGLYERLFHEILECRSPTTVRGLLEGELSGAGVDPAELRVLDVGAGNGIVGEEMADLGVGTLVGLDIIPEAAQAAERDRPDVYDDYRVLDLTALPERERERLADGAFNCMTCVAALGFGDIPPEAFREAYNVVEPGGWIAFTLKEDFLDGADSTGFSSLIRRGVEAGVLDVRAQERYRHRLSTAGEPVHYVAMVGTKREDIPGSLLP